MTHEPPKKRRTAPAPVDEEGAEDKHERPTVNPPPAEEKHERPTVNPPFDVEAYARATADSDAPRRFLRDPATDRRTSGTSVAPTNTSLGASDADDGAPSSQQITVTNEVELEQARARSAHRREPARRLSGSALSIADARARSAPSVPAAAVSTSSSPTSIEAAVLGAIAGPRHRTSPSGRSMTQRTRCASASHSVTTPAHSRCRN